MVPSHPKAPKSQCHQNSSPATSAGSMLNCRAHLSLVCLIAVGVHRGFPPLGRRGSVGGLCRPRQRQRTHQFSVCCSGPRFFTSAGRAPPFLRPARLRRASPTSVVRVGAPLSPRGLSFYHAPYVTHVSPAAMAPLWAVPTPSASLSH